MLQPIGPTLRTSDSIQVVDGWYLPRDAQLRRRSPGKAVQSVLPVSAS
jgi:hypothetical protein